ncbi:MAG: restriction endonuclease subunit S [Gammaproteobacteria bacterium]|nr:restriction endonuclease subunit S [Gammaproteobacteria bacterium]
MKLARFFEKFDQLADAPNAVAKMRGLLIYFAVSGKLVSNNPNEKPVGLKLSGASSDNTALPENWRSGRLGEAFTFEYGDNLPAPKRTETGEYPVYGSNGVVGTHDTYLTKEPAIIVGRKGSAGALNIATGPSWTTDVAYFVRPPSYLDLRFTYYLFSTLRLDELGKGIKPGLSRKEAYELPIALPPLAEQKRIVAKVDELMALCDRLEAQQQERDTCHAALARASLARFAEAPTPANLDFLFHNSYTITPADLRKSILTLAVQGKLVPQDANDEPAEDFLARIGLKTTFISENGPSVSDDTLPPSWARVRFEDIAVVTGGVTLGRKLGERKTVTLPYLRVANVKRGEIDLSIVKEVSIADDEIERYALRDNDLLMTEGGDWDKVGRAAIWRAQIPVCLHQNHIFRARMRAVEISPVWFERYFNSPEGRSYFESASKQTTNLASINMRQVRSCPTPLPPLAEQRRIVAKVDQLIALVDQLETQLTASHATAEKLMQAVVAELTTQREPLATAKESVRSSVTKSPGSSKNPQGLATEVM